MIWIAKISKGRTDRVRLRDVNFRATLYIDGQLTMADHVTALRRSCLFQLR